MAYFLFFIQNPKSVDRCNSACKSPICREVRTHFKAAATHQTACRLVSRFMCPRIHISFTFKPKVQFFQIFKQNCDLTNPYTQIEQVQSHNKVPDVSRETVMSMSRSNTYPGHRVCAAFNHDFFVYESGVCIGVNISNGEIPFASGSGRSIFAISQEKTAGVFYPSLISKILLKDGSEVNIDYYNSSATALVGNCILFNRMNSRILTPY